MAKGEKLLKFRPSSGSGVSIKDQTVAMVGDKNHHITSDGQFGNFLAGKTSFLTDIKQIRVSGFWVLNPALLSTVPSTMVTPNPALRFHVPYDNLQVVKTVLDLFKQALTV